MWRHILQHVVPSLLVNGVAQFEPSLWMCSTWALVGRCYLSVLRGAKVVPQQREYVAARERFLIEITSKRRRGR
jgi:hypothetical protein